VIVESYDVERGKTLFIDENRSTVI